MVRGVDQLALGGGSQCLGDQQWRERERELGNARITDQCVCGDQDHEADIVWCVGPLWVKIIIISQAVPVTTCISVEKRKESEGIPRRTGLATTLMLHARAGRSLAAPAHLVTVFELL